MITISRTFNNDEVIDAALHCFSDIAEDGTSIDCISFNLDSECWLKFDKDGDTIGFMQFKPYNRTTLDIHPYIYSQYRAFSLECGKLALNWFDQFAPEMYRKLISQVPSCHRHIKIYTLKLGFELEGTHKKSFLKGGKLIDLWLFGRERQN